jgi:hypothetical protein
VAAVVDQRNRHVPAMLVSFGAGGFDDLVRFGEPKYGFRLHQSTLLKGRRKCDAGTAQRAVPIVASLRLPGSCVNEYRTSYTR